MKTMGMKLIFEAVAQKISPRDMGHVRELFRSSKKSPTRKLIQHISNFIANLRQPRFFRPETTVENIQNDYYQINL